MAVKQRNTASFRAFVKHAAEVRFCEGNITIENALTIGGQC
jgi:hypothetical protein